MKKTFTIIGFLIVSLIACGQTDSDKQKAYETGREAIELMDKGNYDESIKLLEKSSKLDPENYTYPYEIGYAYILKKEHLKAASYFEKVVKMKDANAQCYQMLGNAYSGGGKKKEAIEAYINGLEKFPKAGRLYLEIGNMQKSDSKALEYYEKGVMVDPDYPSNYYWLAKIFCNSTEEMWGMLYGEMFINLERGSKRTEEISKLLFNTYASEIKFTSDTSMTVSFCQNHVINADTSRKSLPFSMVYEPGMIFSISKLDTINLESLNKIRTNYISFYFDRKFNKSHPNVIFDWHKSLIEKNYFECYNYWLLMKGAPAEFSIWYKNNKERFDNFINWFSDNPMLIDENTNFHRFDY